MRGIWGKSRGLCDVSGGGDHGRVLWRFFVLALTLFVAGFGDGLI